MRPLGAHCSVNICLQFWLIAFTFCDLDNDDDNDDGSHGITDWRLFLIENCINRQLQMYSLQRRKTDK